MSASIGAATSTLRRVADMFEADIAQVWGGERGWYTTGTHVATLVASILREMADEMETPDPSP